MRVYLDDRRPTPPGWVHARWPDDAICLLKTGTVSALSLDNDLGEEGPDAREGFRVIDWLDEAVSTRGFIPPETLLVHSSNSGRTPYIIGAIARIQRVAAGRYIRDDLQTTASE